MNSYASTEVGLQGFKLEKTSISNSRISVTCAKKLETWIKIFFKKDSFKGDRKLLLSKCHNFQAEKKDILEWYALGYNWKLKLLNQVPTLSKENCETWLDWRKINPIRCWVRCWRFSFWFAWPMSNRRKIQSWRSILYCTIEAAWRKTKQDTRIFQHYSVHEDNLRKSCHIQIKYNLASISLQCS